MNSVRIIESLLNRRHIRNEYISMDKTNKMYRLNLYKSYYKKRNIEQGNLRNHNLSFVLTNRNVYNYAKNGGKSSLWVNVFENTDIFESFRQDFPEIIYEPTRLKKSEITEIKYNDIVHFSLGEFQPVRASEYLRTSSFKLNHFHMQIFKLNPVYNPESAEKIIANLQVLIEKYPIWSRHKLNLARFLVPAECSPQDHKVFIVFSSKTDLNEYATEPDSFF